MTDMGSGTGRADNHEPRFERWEIEADAAFARGVDAGLRAWHGDWAPEDVHRLMARNERLKDSVRLARRTALSRAQGVKNDGQ